MIRLKFRKIASAAAVAITTMALLTGQAFASVSVTSPVTANVSSDSATGSSVALPTLIITEGAAAEIPVGTLTWAMPSGYVLDQTSVANVSYGGNGLAGDATVSFPDSTHFSVNVTATSTASSSSLSVGSVTPLKVKASNGSPLAASGNVTLSAGSLAGTASSTSYGTLTQVPGAAAKLVFTIQPPSTTTVGSAFSATVGVQDQFNNLATGDNGRNIDLSANLIASTTAGSLSGTLSHNDASGLAVFSGLSFSAVNQIQLVASSTGLSGATSSTITISATGGGTGTTTPPSRNCGLHNGKLVKVEGSPTIYMVVNCVLRPFTTPAIFHARGKKFSDIIIISSGQFSVLGIGKNIGNGNDDDDTIIINPLGNASTTAPSITGLPNGTVVKIPGNPTVYIVVNGQLQPFPSLVVFKARGKKFGDIKTISQEQFNSLTVGPPLTLPDGTLLQGSGATIFVIEGGKKKGIRSLDSLRKHGWSLKNVIRGNDDDLNGIEHGGDKED